MSCYTHTQTQKKNPTQAIKARREEEKKNWKKQHHQKTNEARTRRKRADRTKKWMEDRKDKASGDDSHWPKRQG